MSYEVDVEESQPHPAVQQRDVSAEDGETLRTYYRDMLRIRRFEERTGEMYTRAKIGGYCHLNLGEEATIVGLMAALQPEDYIYTNYREHGYILARGVAPGPVMAELFGREGGVARGRGGSMHMFSLEHHFMGGYAIVGGQIPLAVGAAFALKYQEREGVVVCQMGDSTTNIGAWHESLNLARLHNLPILFLIVNNGYGMGTRVEKSSGEPDLFKRGCAYRIHGERVDGRDVLSMRDATRRLRERAQREGEPAIIEAVSYRFRGHSVVDPARYRPEDEVQREQADDPLSRFARTLQEAGLVDEAWLNQTTEAVEHEIQEAVDFAESSPEPNVDDLYTFMYATPLANG
jgi:pyruvate dehydrogenase E1 component alpha subunit